MSLNVTENWFIGLSAPPLLPFLCLWCFSMWPPQGQPDTGQTSPHSSTSLSSNRRSLTDIYLHRYEAHLQTRVVLGVPRRRKAAFLGSFCTEISIFGVCDPTLTSNRRLVSNSPSLRGWRKTCIIVSKDEEINEFEVGCCRSLESCVKTSWSVYVGVKCQMGQSNRD